MTTIIEIIEKSGQNTNLSDNKYATDANCHVPTWIMPIQSVSKECYLFRLL